MAGAGLDSNLVNQNLENSIARANEQLQNFEDNAQIGHEAKMAQNDMKTQQSIAKGFASLDATF